MHVTTLLGGLLLHATLALPTQDAPRAEQRIAVLGSSLATGWITSRDRKHDMRNGWAQHLARRLAPEGFRVVNLSIPGNSTADVLARMDSELEEAKADYVIVALSLGNEGIRRDRDKAVAAFRKGLPEIAERCQAKGRSPILGLCYAMDGYGAQDYAALQEVNAWIETLGYPCVNSLGVLEDGAGHFVPELGYEGVHPNDLGHEEMYLAVVPSLFAAIEAGKVPPRRDAEDAPTRWTLGEQAALSFVPLDPMHSFSMSFEVNASGPGIFAAIRLDAPRESQAPRCLTLGVDDEGHIVSRAPGREDLRVPLSAKDIGWRSLTLCHRHWQGRSDLYIDGELAGQVEERLQPREFMLGGELVAATASRTATGPVPVELAHWFVHRAALSTDQVQRLHSGGMLPSSLELYAPLNQIDRAGTGVILNRAQSLSRVRRRLPSTAPHIAVDLATLEQRIESARTGRLLALRFATPRLLRIDASQLLDYVGTYEFAPGDRRQVQLEAGRLLWLDRDNKEVLHYVAEDRFLLLKPGEPNLLFERHADASVTGVTLIRGEQELLAQRVD